MNSYSFSEAAVQDLQEIFSYLGTSEPQVASKLFDAIRQKCKLVANFPNMGKSYANLSPQLRGFIVNDYIVFYYPRETGIEVVRVVNGYQWKIDN